MNFKERDYVYFISYHKFLVGHAWNMVIFSASWPNGSNRTTERILEGKESKLGLVIYSFRGRRTL